MIDENIIVCDKNSTRAISVLFSCRLGRGSQRGRSDGSTVNRLQQLAGGNSPQRFPRIKEERRSRSPREGHRYRDSYSSRRSRSRSRSRERRVRSRSGDRSPSPPPLPPSSNYPPPPPLPSRSPYSRSRSRSRSPPRRRRSSSASVSPPPSSRTYMSYSRWTFWIECKTNGQHPTSGSFWMNGYWPLVIFLITSEYNWNFNNLTCKVFHFFSS